MNKVKEKNPVVTIIIPYYGNQNQCVLDAIESLKKSSISNLQFILVDNGSTANASLNIISDYPEIKLIKLDKNYGVTGGRNTGIDNLYGNEDYVIFFDSDQVAHHLMIEELVKPFYEDKEIGITTPKIFFHPDYIDSSKNKVTNLEDLNEKSSNLIWSAGTDINMITGQVLFRGGLDKEEYQKDAYVNVAPAVLCCSIDAIKKIGHFDDIYFATYEDTDYCFKAKSLGFKIYYCSKAYAWHEIYYDPEGSYKKLLTRLYYVGRNRIIFMRRYAQNFYLFLLFLPVYCFYYTFLCLKYRKFKSVIDFYKGTFEGFFIKI